MGFFLWKQKYRRVTCSRYLPVLDNYARESFDINLENARVFCSPGFYLRNTTSLRKKEEMAMLHIKVCMDIIFIVSDIYAHFLIPKITKFTGSLLKIYVCDVNKTLLSMKVKYIYVIQNLIYTGGTSGKKIWNTVRFISYQFYLYINVISVLCNPNGTLFQTSLILHVWLKSITLVFANILNTFFFFSSKSFY